MRMRTVDGLVIEGSSAEKIVEELAKESWSSVPKEKFMEQVAERVLTQTGNLVRTSSAEEFVADLIDFGFMQEERVQ